MDTFVVGSAYHVVLHVDVAFADWLGSSVFDMLFHVTNLTTESTDLTLPSQTLCSSESLTEPDHL
jgi:hypothetical protein